MGRRQTVDRQTTDEHTRLKDSDISKTDIKTRETKLPELKRRGKEENKNLCASRIRSIQERDSISGSASASYIAGACSQEKHHVGKGAEKGDK